MIRRSKLENQIIEIIHQYTTEIVRLDSRLKEDLYIGDKTIKMIDGNLETEYNLNLYDLDKWCTVRDVVDEVEYRLMDAGFIVFDNEMGIF